MVPVLVYNFQYDSVYASASCTGILRLLKPSMASYYDGCYNVSQVFPENNIIASEM